MTDPAFRELMTALAEGKEEAAAEVFRRYVHRLLALADKLLHKALRQKVDAEDVVQSLLRAFFQRCRDGRVHASDWDELWALLVVMTVRKCRNQASHYHAARRNVGQEVSSAEPGAAAAAWWHALDRTPTPMEAAALAETLEELQNSFDPDDQDIVALHLQGRSAADISRQLQRAERSVRRVCERLRHRLERRLTLSEGS
jgi:RNA polymerase sigma-70 factor (ECF subfamily)